MSGACIYTHMFFDIEFENNVLIKLINDNTKQRLLCKYCLEVVDIWPNETYRLVDYLDVIL